MRIRACGAAILLASACLAPGALADGTTYQTQQRLDIILGMLQLLLIVSTARRVRWLIGLASAFYAAWLVLQIQTWWVPYLRGGSARWMRIYNVWFGKTYKFLPPIDGHPIPDANHTVLTLLIVMALIATVAAFVQAPRQQSLAMR